MLVGISIGIVISCNNSERKVDTYAHVKQTLKGIELEKATPHADPDEFEMEVNNGGLNQYFFNSLGQNCFAILRYFQEKGKTNETKILAEAIDLINPNKLPEAELIENLRERVVIELDDSIVNLRLRTSLKKPHFIVIQIAKPLTALYYRIVSHRKKELLEMPLHKLDNEYYGNDLD